MQSKTAPVRKALEVLIAGQADRRLAALAGADKSADAPGPAVSDAARRQRTHIALPRRTGPTANLPMLLREFALCRPTLPAGIAAALDLIPARTDARPCSERASMFKSSSERRASDQ